MTFTPQTGRAFADKGSASGSETISTQRSCGPVWCFRSVSYNWKFAGVQTWQYLLRLCPVFPCWACPAHAGWGAYAFAQLVAAVGCEKWKLPARHSETKESVQLCKASENFGKSFWTLCSIPPFLLLQKKGPEFLGSAISFRVFLLEVFLGEPRLVVCEGINRTAAVEC